MKRSASIFRRALLGAGLTVAAGGWARRAAAQDGAAFPSRMFRFIVPFPAGSGSDGMARVYAAALGELSGQNVVVDNRPGADGIVAAHALAAAPADGYTIMFGSNSNLATNVALYRKLPYDPIADFTPLSIVEGSYCMIVVPASSPYKTLGDLIADARRRPGTLNHAAGTSTYGLWAQWLAEAAKMRITNIPYKGSGEAVTAVVGAQVDFCIMAIEVAAEMAKSGRLRALAFAGEERFPLLPDVPLASESGAPGFTAFTWAAFVVSAKTPPAIARKLEGLFSRLGSVNAIKARQSQRGLLPVPTGGAYLRQKQLEEIARWRRLVVDSNIPLL